MAMRDWMLRRRVDSPELLDEGQTEAAEVARSLADMRRLNQWLFGVWATVRPLETVIATLPKPLTIVDIGTGSGQVAQAVAAGAMRRHHALRVIGVDIQPLHLRMARRWSERDASPPVTWITSQALTLPFADKSVDIVTSSLFLHHFDPATLGLLFAECRRVARYGVVMTDLWRHPLPFALYQLMEPLFVRSPVTRYDSRVSFRRAYTAAEMEAIAAPHLPGISVKVNIPSFRLVLEWWRGA